MPQIAIDFKNKNNHILEGILTIPELPKHLLPGVLVCHPHPALGGTMNNHVVTSICQALMSQGIASLRFNFRGVGNSQGFSSNGHNEWIDAASALYVIRKWHGIDRNRIGVAGYSFGASVLLSQLDKFKAAKSLSLISSPPSALAGRFPTGDKRPILYVVGNQDQLADPRRLEKMVQNTSTSNVFSLVPGANHSWLGYESKVAEIVADFFSRTL